MGEELNEKILKDIRKTGFPSELCTQAALTAAGWQVSGNRYYLDEDEQKGREVDLDAHRNIFDDDGKPHVCVWSMLSIEVKKSVKPWVVFSSPLDKFLGLGGGYSLLHHNHNVDHGNLPYEVIMRKHPAQGASRLGRSLYVAFSDGETNPSAFGAIVSASKAAYAAHGKAAEHREAWDTDSVDITFYTPVVVLEGKLFECYLDDRGEPVLMETSSITFSLNYLSRAYKERTYLIDIVTAGAVRAYADKHAEWLNDMRTHLVSKVRG